MMRGIYTEGAKSCQGAGGALERHDSGRVTPRARIQAPRAVTRLDPDGACWLPHGKRMSLESEAAGDDTRDTSAWYDFQFPRILPGASRCKDVSLPGPGSWF